MHIPHIEQAYEKIKKTCDSKLSQIYPIQIPEPVNARYQIELEYLKTSDYLDDFEIFRCLNIDILSIFLVIHCLIHFLLIITVQNADTMKPLIRNCFVLIFLKKSVQNVKQI